MADKPTPTAVPTPTDHLLKFFSFDHLPENQLRDVSESCAVLAKKLVGELPPSPELTAGLRKLLEAKDCFVRAAL
jgi:hypothetical protein